MSPPTMRVSNPGLPYGSEHVQSHFQIGPREDRAVWVKVDGVMRKARVNESGGIEVVDQVVPTFFIGDRPVQGVQGGIGAPAPPIPAPGLQTAAEPSVHHVGNPFSARAASPFRPPPPPPLPESCSGLRADVPVAPVTPRVPTDATRYNCTPGGTPVPPQPFPSNATEPERLEKHAVELPSLSAGSSGEAAAIIGDWLAIITPVISSLSMSAHVWWGEVRKAAFDAYEAWLRASPIDRIGLAPDPGAATYSRGKYSLLEPRVYTMILKAVPESMKDDAVQQRYMSVASVLFLLLTRYQPGSSAEKSVMLSFLINPAIPTTVVDGDQAVKKWMR